MLFRGVMTPITYACAIFEMSAPMSAPHCPADHEAGRNIRSEAWCHASKKKGLETGSRQHRYNPGQRRDKGEQTGRQDVFRERRSDDQISAVRL